MISRIILAILFAIFLAPLRVKAGALTLEPLEQPRQIRIHVQPVSDKTTTAILDLIDPGTGRCLATLFAGPINSRGQTIVLTPTINLKPVAYTLRYREGIDLAWVSRLPEPGLPDRKWTNPVDILFAPDALYVMESPLPQADAVQDQFVRRDWSGVDGKKMTGYFISADGDELRIRVGRDIAAMPLHTLIPADIQTAQRLERERQHRLHYPTHIYKLDPQGRPDPAFGDNGRLSIAADRFYHLRSFAVDPLGRIYVSSTYHEFQVFDSQGKKQVSTLGGWDNNAGSLDKGLGWTDSIVLGDQGRAYIPTAYGTIKVYDYSKPGFAGFLYAVKLPAQTAMGRCLAFDQARIYLLGSDNSISRFKDDGKELTLDWTCPMPVRLAKATGIAASADLIWVSDHGPGFGPFWDSGGGGS